MVGQIGSDALERRYRYTATVLIGASRERLQAI
jgi:hypothetical protein